MAYIMNYYTWKARVPTDKQVLYGRAWKWKRSFSSPRQESDVIEETVAQIPVEHGQLHLIGRHEEVQKPVVVVISTIHAHARILNIDDSEALALFESHDLLTIGELAALTTACLWAVSA